MCVCVWWGGGSIEWTSVCVHVCVHVCACGKSEYVYIVKWCMYAGVFVHVCVRVYVFSDSCINALMHRNC